MAVIEYDEYKQKLLALEPTLGELEKALGIPKAREELAELQQAVAEDSNIEASGTHNVKISVCMSLSSTLANTMFFILLPPYIIHAHLSLSLALP